MGVTRRVALATLALPGTRALAAPSLVRPLGDVEVDWAAGVVSARAGAAADLRLPGAAAARPAAVRQATERAKAALRRALPELPTGGPPLDEATISAALARAKQTHIEHQSNGGVLLTLAVSFAALVGLPDDAPEVSLSVPTTSLALRPVVGTARVGYATYRLAEAPSGAKAARRDKEGRLIISSAVPAGLERARVVIYTRNLR